MVGQNESFMGNFSNSSRGNSDADGIMSTIKSSASSLCEKFQDIISSTVSKLSKDSKKGKKGNQSFISSLINNIDKDLLYATENDDSNLQQLLLNQERLEDSTRAWQDVFFSTWFRRNNKNSNHRNEELLNGISKVKEGLASIGVGSAISNMTNNTTSSFERQLEFIKDIRTELGLTGKQWNNLESVIDSKVYNPLNREFGYIFSQEDKLNSINDLVEMGVRDQGEMVQLMPYMLKWQKVGGDMSADELKYLRPVLSKMGTDSLDAIGDTAAKLSKDFGVSFKDLVTSLNQDKMYNEIMINSKGNADVFKKSSKSFLGAITLMKNSFIDSETMTSLLTDLSKKSLADLNESGITQQLALAGLSVQDLKEQVKSGDFMGATNAIIQGLGEFVEQNPDMAENIAGILGYDVDFLNELGLYHDDANANYDKINKSIEDSEGSLDDRLRNLPVSMTERFGNWFNSLSLVKNFMKFMQSLEIGMDDVFYTLGILKLLPETFKKGFSDFTTGVVKGFGSFVNDIVDGITNGVSKVFQKVNPFSSKMKTPAGSKGATLSKKILGESDDVVKSTAKNTKKLTGAHPGQRRLTEGSAPKVDDFAPPPSGSGLKGASDDLGRNASKTFTEPPPSYTKPTEFIDTSYKSVDDVAKKTTSSSKDSFSKLFKKGSKSVDDVTKTSSSQGFFSKLFKKGSKSVDDVATSASKSKSGFFSKSTSKSTDTIVSKAGKTMGKSADDLAKNASFLSKAGSKLGKALGPIGVLVGAGTSAANIAKADDKKKATAKEAGGWLGGAAGGAVAGAAAGSVAGPVGTAIGGIVGGIAGSIGGEKVAEWLYDNFDKIKDKASEVGQWVGDKFNEGWTAIEGVWNTVATWFSDNIWTPISNFASECWTAIEGVWNTVADWFQTNIWDPIANFASDCWTGITDVWNTVADWFQTNIWDPISTFAENAFYFVVGLGAMAWEGIQAVWNTVADWFQTNIWDPLSSAVDVVIQWFKDGFSNAWTFISETWATVTQWFTDTIWTPLTEAVSTTVQWFQDAFNNAWTFISEVWATVTQWFQDTIWTPLTEAVSTTVQWFQDSFNNAWTFISGVWSTVSQWFQDTIWTPVSTAVGVLKDALSNAFSTAWSTIQGIWGSVSSWFSDTIWNPISNTATSVWNAISSTISGVVDAFKSAWGGVSSWFSSNVTGPIQSVWDSTVGAISAGFEKITGWIGGVIEKGKSVVHGSKRTGMVYTPYDGFRAELHKGEVVRSIDGSFSSKVPYDGLVTTLSRGDEVMTAYAVRELERRKSDYSSSDAVRDHSLDSKSRVDRLYNSSVYNQTSSLSSIRDKSLASATTGLYDLSSIYDTHSLTSTSSVSDKSMHSVASNRSSIASSLVSQLSSLYGRISSSLFYKDSNSSDSSVHDRNLISMSHDATSSRDSKLSSLYDRISSSILHGRDIVTSPSHDSSYMKDTSSAYSRDSVASRLYSLLHYQNLVSRGLYDQSLSSETSDKSVNYSSSSLSSYDKPSNSSISSQSQVTEGSFSPSLYDRISRSLLYIASAKELGSTSSVLDTHWIDSNPSSLYDRNSSSVYDRNSASGLYSVSSLYGTNLMTESAHEGSANSDSYIRDSITSTLLSLYDNIYNSLTHDRTSVTNTSSLGNRGSSVFTEVSSSNPVILSSVPYGRDLTHRVYGSPASGVSSLSSDRLLSSSLYDRASSLLDSRNSAISNLLVSTKDLSSLIYGNDYLSSVHDRDSVVTRSHRLSSLYDMTSETTSQGNMSVYGRDSLTTGIHNSSLYDKASSSVAYTKEFVGDRIHDSSSYDRSSIASKLLSLYDRVSSSVYAGFNSLRNSYSVSSNLSSLLDRSSIASNSLVLDRATSSSLHGRDSVANNSSFYDRSMSSLLSSRDSVGRGNYNSELYSNNSTNGAYYSALYDRNSIANDTSSLSSVYDSASMLSLLLRHKSSSADSVIKNYDKSSSIADRSSVMSSLSSLYGRVSNLILPSRDSVASNHGSSLVKRVMSSILRSRDSVVNATRSLSSTNGKSVFSNLASLLTPSPHDSSSSYSADSRDSVRRFSNSALRARDSILSSVYSKLSLSSNSSSVNGRALRSPSLGSRYSVANGTSYYKDLTVDSASSLRSANLVDSSASSVYNKVLSSLASRNSVAPNVSSTRSLVAPGIRKSVNSSNSNISSSYGRNSMSNGLYDLSSKSRSVIIPNNSVRSSSSSSVTAPSPRSMSVLNSNSPSSTIDLSTMDSLLANNSMLRSTKSESKSSSYSNIGGMGATSVEAMNNYFDKVAKYIKVSLSASSENSTTSTNSNTNSGDTGSSSNSLVNAARSFKGAKYVWGGKDYPSLDCSGLVASAFEKLGWVDSKYKYNNNAQAIRSQSSALSKSSAGAGDLAFLVKGGEATHIGIVSGTASNGNHTVVHSSSGHGGYAEESNSTYWNAWGRFSKATGTTSSNARTTTVTGGSPKGTASQVDFIKMLAPGAVKSKSNGSTLPSVTMSQGILESGWGKSSLATKAKNLFGIKVGSSWKGKYVEMPTTEYSGGKPYKTTAKFRAYDSFSDSIEDHGNLLKNNSRYSSVISAKTYKEATKALSSAGYATDPNYPSLLNNIIEDYNLSSYDGATVDNSVGDTVTSSGTDAKSPKVTVNVENAELVKTLRWQVAELTKAYANANKPTKSSSRQSNAVASIFEFA